MRKRGEGGGDNIDFINYFGYKIGSSERSEYMSQRIKRFSVLLGVVSGVGAGFFVVSGGMDFFVGAIVALIIGTTSFLVVSIQSEEISSFVPFVGFVVLFLALHFIGVLDEALGLVIMAAVVGLVLSGITFLICDMLFYKIFSKNS